MRLILAMTVLLLLVPERSAAQTPAEAYKRGCAACHSSESAIVRRIPQGDEASRRAWVEAFLAQHPCERDDLKALIIEYLLERSRR